MNPPAPSQSRSSARGGAASVRRIEQRIGAMFADCLQAFHAFGELAELAENLRVLSLNAELAAGRAGERGRAVRALTQYTRELVNRLGQIQADTTGLMARTYAQTATALRAVHQMRLLDRAVEEIDRGRGEYALMARNRISDSRDQTGRVLNEAVRLMVANIDNLAARTRVVGEVVSASDSIATNIAIEAVGAGVYEMEFRTVAETMRRYVEQLRTMIEDASAAVRSATEKGAGLQRAGMAAVQSRGRN